MSRVFKRAHRVINPSKQILRGLNLIIIKQIFIMAEVRI